MKVRVTEQVASVAEVSYDVDLPEGADVDDVEEYLDRASDEVHRETLRSNREITGTEVLEREVTA